MNKFILSYNPLNESVTAAQLTVFIKVSREIDGWHSPFLGTYLIKSQQGLTQLQQSFSELFGDESFVLATVDLLAVSGYLPATIWNWFSVDNVNSYQGLLSLGLNPPPPPPPRR